MKINALAITVGNTRTKLGLFLEGNLDQWEAIPNTALDAALPNLLQDMVRQLQGGQDAAILLASVNPAVCAKAERFAQQAAGNLAVLRMERDVPIAVGRQLDPEALPGEDRLLNAAGAYDTLKQTCVVIDAGTAITVDLVDGAGTFHGGAIAPGASLMLRSLHDQTAQLPQLEPQKPLEPLGHNTIQAMHSGVFYGLRGLVRELTEQYAQTIGSYPMVIATGGDSQLLFGEYELVERLIPELTLLGMAASYRRFLSDDPLETPSSTPDADEEN